MEAKNSPKKQINFDRIVSGFFLFLFLFTAVGIVFAVTPNPGHPWTEVGDGTFAVTGPTTIRTYTYPDSNATVLTSAAAVMVAQGGTGAATFPSGGFLFGNGTSALSASSSPTVGWIVATTTTASSTFQKFSAVTSDVGTVINGTWNANTLGVAYGGTASTSLTANALLVGNGTGNLQTVVAGEYGSVLASNGTTWVATSTATTTTVVTRPVMATGAVSSVAANSLTTRNVGLFNTPEAITVNQIAYNVAAVTTAGTYRICLYDETGNSKLIDVTDVPAAGVNTVTVSPAVYLPASNYYVAIGCSVTCNNTISTFTTTATAWVNGASVPAGKKIHEGTVTHTSGTCNSTLGTITGSNSKTPVLRLDN